jgi:hypothetical protein
VVVPASCDELGAHLDELGLGDVDAFERSQLVAVTGDHWKEQRANMLPNDRIATISIVRCSASARAERRQRDRARRGAEGMKAIAPTATRLLEIRRTIPPSLAAGRWRCRSM